VNIVATELVLIVEANGGQFVIDGEELVIRPGDAAMPVLEQLRAHKQAIVALLRSRTQPQAGHPEQDSEALLSEWMLERCAYRDHSWTLIAALQLDHARWCEDHGRPVCASRLAFVSALEAEGFTVTDGWCYGLLLSRTIRQPQQSQKETGIGYGNQPCKRTTARAVPKAPTAHQEETQGSTDCPH
jgi:hypothetical protein